MPMLDLFNHGLFDKGAQPNYAVAASAPALEHDAAPIYQSLADEPILNIVRLIRSQNVGPITFFKLLTRYRTTARAISALPMLAARGGARDARLCSVEVAQAEIDATKAAGASFVPYGHAHYPKLLMQIPDAPPLLTVKGHSHLLNSSRILAMVGARNASGNACRFAGNMATELGNAGYVIASGLARGIDTYAHQGALRSGTIGVTAGGIDQIYPAENKALFEQMAELGVIVTESPFGAPPQSRHFPARNRIIAGMAKAVVVVEAASKSGSLITARCALEYNRDIFAVPGFPLDPRSAGTNHLIQQGAMLASSAHDVLDYIINQPHFVRDCHSGASFYTLDAVDDDEQTLDAERNMILSLLGHTPLMIEEILQMSNITPRIVNVILLELEIAGMINYHFNGGISRKYDD